MATATTHGRLEVRDVKTAAKGRTIDVLVDVAGIPRDLLDGRHHPCPQCGGVDRFRLIDVAAGAVRCNACRPDRCGDFIAAIEWMTEQAFPEALRTAAEYLGMEVNGNGRAKPTDILVEFARRKHVMAASLEAYGATRGDRNGAPVVRIPMFNQIGLETGHQDYGLSGDLAKGLTNKGGKAGLFLPGPGDLPKAGETWLMVEGVKDAAALHTLGYKVAGTPGTVYRTEWARIFRDTRMVLIPDRDRASYDHFGKVQQLLEGVVLNAGKVDLPFPMQETGGKDTRDLLQQTDGEETLKSLIGDALKKASTTDARITNAVEVGAGKDRQLVPLAMEDVIQRIDTATKRWPRRVEESLFVDDRGGESICWLDSSAALFGWLSRLVGVIRWSKANGCVSKGEVFAELQRTAERYVAIESLPHEPKIVGHYYACETPDPGDGRALETLLDFFSPETLLDRCLLLSAFATPLWGGPTGRRPAFLFTAKTGRGVGKSTAAQIIGQLHGGIIDFSLNSKADDIKKRLLSKEGLRKRIALLDNVKTLKFSCAELEAIITSDEISGHRMYSGEGARPNFLTWLITLNGASLSTDMSQRIVEVRFSRPVYSGNWEADIRGFIGANRQKILGDLIGFLRRQRVDVGDHSRWASWERDVLGRLPDAKECLGLIVDRRAEVDAEKEEGEAVEEYFADRLQWLGYDPDRDDVFIPSKTASRWYNTATGEAKKSVGVTTSLKQLRDEGKIDRIVYARVGPQGKRGFRWIGEHALADELTKCDLHVRLAKKLDGQQHRQNSETSEDVF